MLKLRSMKLHQLFDLLLIRNVRVKDNIWKPYIEKCPHSKEIIGSIDLPLLIESSFGALGLN